MPNKTLALSLWQCRYAANTTETLARLDTIAAETRRYSLVCSGWWRS